MPDAFRFVRIFAPATLIAVLLNTTTFAQVIDAVRIGAINLSYVARSSRIGKTELARIEDATRKRAAEIDLKAAELQKQQTELQKTGIGLSPRAAGDLQRSFEKSRLELERFQQDARNEIEAMQTRFDVDFRARLAPVIDEISKEKGLYFVFGLEQAAIVWWNPALDISDEVVKRLDADKK
jgi:Skp family chaperone for outer membrane proteins